MYLVRLVPDSVWFGMSQSLSHALGSRSGRTSSVRNPLYLEGRCPMNSQQAPQRTWNASQRTPRRNTVRTNP